MIFEGFGCLLAGARMEVVIFSLQSSVTSEKLTVIPSAFSLREGEGLT